MQKCLACGIEKDINSREVYPYKDDCITTEEPVQPLFELECQANIDHTDFRIVTICHNCFHKVQPDMWMSQGEWESLNPVTNFNDLPKLPDKDAPKDSKETYKLL